MKLLRRDRGVTTVEWVIVAMVIGVGCIAVFRTFKDSYMTPATNRMGDCIEAAAGDGNLCGGLATGGASSGGGGNAAAGNATGGALAQNGAGAGAGGNGVGGNGANAGGGNGMSAGDLVSSVGGGHGGENPHAGVVNAISNGFSLEQAAEDALINATKKATGTEIPKGLERAIGLTRAGVGAAVGAPLDIIANGLPHNGNDAASLATKTAIVGAIGYLGGPIGAVAAVGLDKSLGYIADSITNGNRYAGDYQDSIAWRMAHGQAGTIGKEGLEAQQANEQRMLHDQLDYMHQQQQRDAQALREMMPH
jgi:hypothetical protein